MREVRVDAFTNNMIIIVKDRDKRPIDTKICQKDIESKNMYEEKCPFCICYIWYYRRNYFFELYLFIELFLLLFEL